MIGVGLLWLSGTLFYGYEDYFGPDSRPSTALVCIGFGSGFLLTGGGLIATAAGLDRKHRAILGISLLAFGSITLVLAMAIAHAPMLLVFALPALVFGFYVGLMAMPSQQPPSRDS
jgi:hypothetical protein